MTQHTDAPMPFPNDERLAEPDMTPEQIRQWIEACNHEPARRVLRQYILLRSHFEEECSKRAMIYLQKALRARDKLAGIRMQERSTTHSHAL